MAPVICATKEKVLDFVTVDEDIFLEGSFEFIIKGKVHSDSKNMTYLFEPCVDKLIDRELLAASCIVWSQNGFIPVRVFSPTGKLKLYKGTRVGFIIPLNETHENLRSIRKQTSIDITKHVDLNHVNKQDVHTITDLLQNYSDIFSKSKMDIGFTSNAFHKIDTGNAQPIAVCPRRIPVALESKVDLLIDDLLESKVIRRSESPWCSPVVVVKKPSGEIRMCIDYRKLNSVTNRPIYPIPDTQNIFDTLSGARYFSTLDLNQAYYQVGVKEEDAEKTAFATKKGHFEFLRMPFGLCGAPATFQKLMCSVLSNENWTKCLVYLDDIIIFGNTIEQHNERLKAVLQRLREANLKISPSKCCFLKNEVKYLGHIISVDGIQTDPEKIQKVSQWPTPKTPDDVSSFLGLAGYYRKFIRNYAQLVAPLESLKATYQKRGAKIKHKSSAFVWGEIEQNAFDDLKHALTTSPILTLPNNSDPIILDTDASHYMVGAVLSQVQDGKERVLSYASHKLTKAERAYCITRKELLAVYKYVKQYKHYLLGRKFTVRTDHQALRWMLDWERPNTSQYCKWRAELECYDMKVVHRAGKLHGNADALSRLPSCQQCGIAHDDPRRRRNVKLLENNPIRLRSIADSSWCQSDDDELCIIEKLMKSGDLHNDYPPILRNGSKSLKKLWSSRKLLRIRGDQLYMLNASDEYLLLVPRNRYKQLVMSYHSNFGHIGAEKCAELIKKKYFWPFMSRDIRYMVNSCRLCAERKVPANSSKNTEHFIHGYPFEKVCIDISGPFPMGIKGEKYILAMIDSFSKYIVLVPLNTTDAETVATAIFTRWIAIFGAPVSIHSDRGTNFESAVVAELTKVFGIHKTHSTPYHPQGNSIVERLFRTVKDMIFSTAKSRRKSWSEVIPIVEIGLRCSKHATTLESPYEVIFGNEMRVPLAWHNDIHKMVPQQYTTEYILKLRERLADVRENIAKRNMIVMSEEREIRRKYCIGELVLARIVPHQKGILTPRYEGPFKIIGTKKQCIQMKHCLNGQMIERNENEIKHCKSNRTIVSGITKETSIISKEQTNAKVNRNGNECKKAWPIRKKLAPQRLGFC